MNALQPAMFPKTYFERDIGRIALEFALKRGP
jgi:hypothetical protein